MKSRSVIGAFALVATILISSASQAQDAAKFYAGKTITFIVGYGSGASFDIGTRLISRHMAQYIPGKPSIVVQNMPGAGSMRAANYLYAAAPKDGSTIGMFGRGLYLEALFGNPSVKFDPLKFNWIGSHGREVSVLVTGKDTPFKTVADIRKQEIIIGASGPGADTYTYALVLRELAGAKVKIVSGFPGQAAAFLALDRGEVQGNAGATIGTLMALRPQWLKQPGLANFVVQLATEAHPTMLKGVPVIMDFAKDDIDRQALEMAFARQKIAYAFAAPPGVPADRVAALREAFWKAVKDPQFLAEAEKMNTDIAPVGGEEILKVMRSAYDAPKAVLERAKAAMTVKK